MRIIRIFTRSWAWREQKIKQQNGVLSYFGSGKRKRPDSSSAIFHDFHCEILRRALCNFPQQCYNIFQQIFHIITPSKYQYKKRGKIIIHLNRENVKRGGEAEKNGGLQWWLEMSIPLTRNWRSFSVSPLYTECPVVSI